MKTKKRCIAVLALCAVMLLSSCGGAKALYTAGTYTASVDGYAGPVTVEVDFDEKSITAVRIVSHKETLDIGDRAVEKLRAKIVEAQTWDVDAITAATVTSGAIRDAVKSCMEQAAIKE